MKFIRKFSSDVEMNDAISLIKNSGEIYIFTTNLLLEKLNVVYIPNKSVPDESVYSVNMSPVKLDSSSTKKKPVVGDVLYSTADGKLTLDALTNNKDNTPIAICVIPEVTENFKNGDDSAGAVKTARFVSLNYMNYKEHTTGNKNYQDIYFGNFDVTIGNVKGGTDKTSYIGGKWNTQLCLSKVTKLDLNICDEVINSGEAGYCAPVCCCVSYSTPGTKPGDWYLPAIGELYQIYTNKTIINKKRTTLVGSEFHSLSYWSSREYDSKYEYCVHLNYGGINAIYKDSNIHALAFLALELPVEK